MYGCGLNLLRVHDGENELMEGRMKQRATSHTRYSLMQFYFSSLSNAMEVELVCYEN
jgi:hypothetical protein